MQPILIDTNLLVYVYDLRDPNRQSHSAYVIGNLAKTGIGFLSTQSLAEFFNATSRVKRGQPPILSVPIASAETEKLARAFPVFSVTQPIVIEALRGVRQHHLSYWDSQIWAAARLNQIPIIFSEDFSPGSVLDGIQFVNPFAPGFRLTDWIN